VESGFKDENGNQLAHEIEKYDETTDNELIAWVRVPRLSYTGDTVITIHYGNDDIGTATANPAGVWDSNFTGVWHLNEDVTDEQTSGTHDDSTGANVGSQNGNVEGTGKFADGQDFDGLTYANADYIDTGTSPGSATDLTVSYWMKAEVNNAYMRALGKFALNDAGDQGWNFLVRPSEETGYDRALIFRIGDFGAYGFWGNEITAEQLYDAGQWVHVVGTFAYNGSAGGTGTLYVDGSQVASKSNTDNRGVANTATPFLIGWDSSIQGGGEDFNGIIDEVRISDSVRDLCWIQTEFANQCEPGVDPGCTSTFYGISAEMAFTTAISLLSFTATGQNDTVQVAWETASETGNLGFSLYRADSPAGPYRRITDQLIAGLNFSAEGRVYNYADTDVTAGQPYFYKLEDLDMDGRRTFHGPVGVDWDGTGAPAVTPIPRPGSRGARPDRWWFPMPLSRSIKSCWPKRASTGSAGIFWPARMSLWTGWI
jgi:hypothetical protein